MVKASFPQTVALVYGCTEDALPGKYSRMTPEIRKSAITKLNSINIDLTSSRTPVMM